MEDKKILSPHSLMLENRQGGRITGVKDVKSFDEKEILLFTQAGKLVIKGEQLHVKQLDLIGKNPAELDFKEMFMRNRILLHKNKADRIICL